MGCVVPNGGHVQSPRVEDFAEQEVAVGRHDLGHRGQRICQRGQKAVAGCTRQPPGHDPQRARSENVEQAGDAVKSDGGRDAAQGADGRRQRRHQRRIGGFKGNAVIPKRPPGGVKPTAARARGERRPEPVHGTHVRGGREKHVAAYVNVDPQEGQQIERGAQHLHASGGRDGGVKRWFHLCRGCGALHIGRKDQCNPFGREFDSRAACATMALRSCRYSRRGSTSLSISNSSRRWWRVLRGRPGLKPRPRIRRGPSIST